MTTRLEQAMNSCLSNHKFINHNKKTRKKLTVKLGSAIAVRHKSVKGFLKWNDHCHIHKSLWEEVSPQVSVRAGATDRMRCAGGFRGVSKLGSGPPSTLMHKPQ